MLTDEKLYFLASDISISEQKSNDIFLYVTMRMLSTRPNGNREGVTQAFIDEIVSNTAKYDCLPLYVDINRLRARDYRNLGHMYNPGTGKFESTQIGSLCRFWKESDEYGISLMGEARIPKREADVCQCVLELYNIAALNFSFEIKYVPDNTVVIEGVRYVDAADTNALTGMAIVSTPAYRESTALSLVAEEKADGAEAENATEGVENKVTIEEAMQAIAEKDQLIAELQQQNAAIAEENEKLKEEAKPDPEAEEKAKRDEETAAAAEEERKQCAEKLEEANAAAAEKDQKIEELNAQIEELNKAKAELETIKAEQAAAELKAKQENAKAFAQKQGLDVEDEKVQTAIAELNYEAIAEMAMEISKPETQTATASFVITENMKVESKYGGLLESR